ncbi:ABC transporter substrate-binding protein [Candidatus Omnitrophota bacterium]
MRNKTNPVHRKSFAAALALSLALLFLAMPSAPGENAPLKKAGFMPQWEPQAQFAGYYVALKKGIYEKHGIELTLINGGPDFSPRDFLKDGKVDFATLWLSTGIKQRVAGLKLVNIAQIVQKSSLMLIAKKKSGINVPGDMNNKKIGLWDNIYQVQPKAFFKKYDLDVEIVPQSYTVNLFLRDGVDVASAMWYNEYHTILNYGYDPDELSTFFYHDHGLNFPEDGIYALEDTFNKDPELARAFVKASLEGWVYAFGHPEEAVDIVMQYMKDAHIPANRAHQEWMFEKVKELIVADNSVPMGELRRSDYEKVAEVLLESGVIKEIPPFNQFYRDCRKK